MVKKGLSKFWDEVGSQMDNNYAYYLCPSMSRYKRREFCKLLDKIDIRKHDIIIKTDSFEEAFGQDKIIDYLSIRSDKVFGLDISYNIIMTSMKRLNNSFSGGIATNISDMPFGDNTIDIIFSSSTYGYLNDIRKGLKEAFRIIKPGGTLVVSVNNRSNLSFRVLTKVYSFLGCIPFPVSNLYRLNKMRSLLEDVGFNIDYQEPIVHIPPLLNMLFSFLDNSGSKFSSTLSRLLMKIIHKYSDSKLGVKCFTGWYILFKVDKPKD